MKGVLQKHIQEWLTAQLSEQVINTPKLKYVLQRNLQSPHILPNVSFFNLCFRLFSLSYGKKLFI